MDDTDSTTDTPTSTHGGSREGAGRPAGSRNALPYGAVQALRSMRWRVPADAHPAVAEGADYALARIFDVLAGRVPAHKSTQVLKAAVVIREEFCGPVTRKMEVAQATTVNVVNPYAVPPSLEETQPE